MRNAIRNMGNVRPKADCSKIMTSMRIFGAGDRDRTDDIQLGKLTFYH
jgi:hypothetical protein